MPKFKNEEMRSHLMRLPKIKTKLVTPRGTSNGGAAAIEQSIEMGEYSMKASKQKQRQHKRWRTPMISTKLNNQSTNRDISQTITDQKSDNFSSTINRFDFPESFFKRTDVVGKIQFPEAFLKNHTKSRTPAMQKTVPYQKSENNKGKVNFKFAIPQREQNESNRDSVYLEHFSLLNSGRHSQAVAEQI